MILTGQAKKDFEKWYISTESVDIYKGDCNDQVFNTIRNALIIEWFDSVGIYVNISNLYHQNSWCYKVKNCPEVFEEKIMTKSRKDATIEAIVKANEIYNLK